MSVRPTHCNPSRNPSHQPLDSWEQSPEARQPTPIPEASEHPTPDSAQRPLPNSPDPNEPGMEITEALLDSGASGKFIDKYYARDIHMEKKDLCKPIKVYNVDSTPNKQGMITQYVKLYLTIHKWKRKQQLLVTGLGRQQIILEYLWLKEMNPLIDWEKGTLEWRKWKNSAL